MVNYCQKDLNYGPDFYRPPMDNNTLASESCDSSYYVEPLHVIIIRAKRRRLVTCHTAIIWRRRSRCLFFLLALRHTLKPAKPAWLVGRVGGKEREREGYRSYVLHKTPTELWRKKGRGRKWNAVYTAVLILGIV